MINIDYIAQAIEVAEKLGIPIILWNLRGHPKHEPIDFPHVTLYPPNGSLRYYRDNKPMNYFPWRFGPKPHGARSMLVVEEWLKAEGMIFTVNYEREPDKLYGRWVFEIYDGGDWITGRHKHKPLAVAQAVLGMEG